MTGKDRDVRHDAVHPGVMQPGDAATSVINSAGTNLAGTAVGGWHGTSRVRAAVASLLVVFAVLSLLPAEASAAPLPDVVATKAVVDISEQRAYFYAADGALLVSFAVSTGAPATPTRKGVFKVYSRSRSTFPRSNPKIRMSWMTRFDGGIGFHGIPYRTVNGEKRPLPTPLGRRGVSHGCVRMPDKAARWVFEHLRTGASVRVRP